MFKPIEIIQTHSDFWEFRKVRKVRKLRKLRGVI